MRQRGRSPGPSDRSYRWNSRIPLSEIKKGYLYDGTVKYGTPKRGIFVDFGAERDGLLRVSPEYIRSFTPGMPVYGMTVVSCNPDSGRVTLQPDPSRLPDIVNDIVPFSRQGPPQSRQSSRSPSRSPPDSVYSRPSNRSRRTSRSRNRDSSSATASTVRGRYRPRSRSMSRARREWDHPDGTALAELSAGQVVNGDITGANRFGVFLNFGAVKDGRIIMPRKFQREFKVGDFLDNVLIEEVDLEMNRVTLALPDLDATIQSLQQDRVPLEELEEGTIVDGIISAAGPYGIFIHIGATKDAKLRVPRKVQMQMNSGERVNGMRIARIDLERQHITLVFDDLDERYHDVLHEGKDTPQRSRESSWARPPERRRNNSRRGDRPVSVPPPRDVPSPRETMDDAPVSLEEIFKGELANGVVVEITKQGVMVDIGAETYGTLTLSSQLRQQFQVNDMVEGMKVEEVDLRRRQVLLSMDEPELAVVDNNRPFSPAALDESQLVPAPPPYPRPREGKSKGRSKVK